MCVQCMMSAMVATAGATGARGWLKTRLGPKALKRATVVLLTLALIASATLSGAGS
jgi:hypothetical protein